MSEIEGYLTGVGSREVPAEVLTLISDVAEVQTTRGYRWRSGGAGGSDEAFHQGAMRSPRFAEIGVEIYLPWNGFKREGLPTLYHNPEQGIYNAGSFENFKEAEAISLEARGSWEGLGQGGIKLHTRNAYQPLGRHLNQKSRSLVCYAKPVGKKGEVKGGTNTAVKIALAYNIRVINLFLEDQRRLIEDWLKTQKQ